MTSTNEELRYFYIKPDIPGFVLLYQNMTDKCRVWKQITPSGYRECQDAKFSYHYNMIKYMNNLGNHLVKLDQQVNKI